MKVALLIQAFLNNPGGAEKVAGKLANLLVKNGIECTIICAPKHVETSPYALSPEVSVIELSRKRDYEWFAHRGKYDLLVGFAMSGCYAEIMNKAKVLDCPYVVQECSSPRRMLSLMAANQQDGIATPREAFWLRQALLANANAIRLTVPDYEETLLHPIRAFAYSFYNSLNLPEHDQLPLDKRPKKIVAVGALKNDNKNGLTAAKAFLDSGMARSGWRLEFYGTNNFQNELKEIQARPGGDAISDHGLTTNTNEMYEDANLLLIPSFEEGLPNVIIEAFHYGVPAIGFAECSGTNHLIAHNERGLLVENYSHQLMGKAIASLCKDTKERMRLGVNAKHFSDQHFDEATFEKNWLTLIKNAISGKNRFMEDAKAPINDWPDKEAKKALVQLTALHQSIATIEKPQ